MTKKVLLVMASFVFSVIHQKLSSHLSPLSSSWLNAELLHSHRGDGLDLAKDLGWVDRRGRGDQKIEGMLRLFIS